VQPVYIYYPFIIHPLNHRYS